ncbi:MAG TPA: RodZ domain-containing protein [Candidatus Obscuribacterales bacterium]
MNLSQQEQLTNIGAYLREVRTESGKAIDEVANQIFIRPALVRAIEAGDWESLPEPVFVQGFIRRYADYLGLDGREVAKQFEPTPVSVLPNPVLANSSAVEGVVKQQDRHELKVISKAEPPPSTLAPRPRRTGGDGFQGGWLLGLGGVAAAIALIAWIATRNTPQPAATPPELAPTTSTPSDTPPAAAPAPVAETAEPPAATPPEAETPDAAATDAPITFAVNVESDSWMRIIVDGEEVYEGILTTGTQQAWTAETELRVTAGNSGGVLYSFNGSDEAPLGAPGAVSNLTLTPTTTPPTAAPQ